MSERIIWRPNEVSPDQWDAMTRAEQIAWWKDREARKPISPKPHMMKAIALYSQGNITLTDFCTFAISHATADEIGEFIAECPPELMTALTQRLALYPEDAEDEWPRTFQIRSYAPWVTSDEIKAFEQEEENRFRDGVRVLREYFSAQRERE